MTLAQILLFLLYIYFTILMIGIPKFVDTTGIKSAEGIWWIIFSIVLFIDLLNFKYSVSINKVASIVYRTRNIVF